MIAKAQEPGQIGGFRGNSPWPRSPPPPPRRRRRAHGEPASAAADRARGARMSAGHRYPLQIPLVRVTGRAEFPGSCRVEERDVACGRE